MKKVTNFNSANPSIPTSDQSSIGELRRIWLQIRQPKSLNAIFVLAERNCMVYANLGSTPANLSREMGFSKPTPDPILSTQTPILVVYRTCHGVPISQHPRRKQQLPPLPTHNPTDCTSRKSHRLGPPLFWEIVVKLHLPWDTIRTPAAWLKQLTSFCEPYMNWAPIFRPEQALNLQRTAVISRPDWRIKVRFRAMAEVAVVGEFRRSTNVDLIAWHAYESLISWPLTHSREPKDDDNGVFLFDICAYAILEGAWRVNTVYVELEIGHSI